MNHDGMRQAAVLLASLHPRDRAWIRRRLPHRWWLGLKQLVKHLHAPGPIDADILHDALEGAHPETPEPATPDVLLAGLEGLEPAWVARTLIACAPDHKEIYASARAPAARAALERALREGPASLPPQLAAALAIAVRRRGERALELEGRA